VSTESSFPLPNFTTDLTGQVAIVTGATSGLGRRFAECLAAAGASVATTGRRAERLDEVVEGIQKRGGTAIAVPLDVRDADAIVAAVKLVEDSLGPVTILVNNAGIPDAQYATKMSVELIDSVIDTNLRAPYLLSREVANRLIHLKLPGRIVNISSMGAYGGGGSGATLYAITKAGVVRMTEVLSAEWAKFGINVTGIAPGAFNSEMMDGMISRIGEIAPNFPRQRMGEPAQLDSTLLFLVSPSSEFVTGTVIKVEDGQSSR
jgi:NAD(P)-dependent dehydrogenase (short-subunit alcohol dehydrogenase family)